MKMETQKSNKSTDEIEKQKMTDIKAGVRVSCTDCCCCVVVVAVVVAVVVVILSFWYFVCSIVLTLVVSLF